MNRSTPMNAQHRADLLLVLRLPVELAASQHPVWCLVCRLACFCPAARLSMLILGEEAFAPPGKVGDRKRTA